MKKLLAVLISVLFICTSIFSVSVYAEETGMSYDTPIVVIRGIAFTGLTIDEGTPDERESVVLPDSDAITSLVLDVAKTFLFTQKLDVDAIVDVADQAIGSLACDENGNSIHNVSYSKYPLSANHYNNYDDEAPGEWGIYSTAIDYYGAEKVYFFTYDWRMDPTDIADDLHEMIERAKSDNNSDKVDIVCCSMGGIIADCYLYEYGCESVDTIIFDSSTFCGTHFTTDLLQGKILISPEMLKYFVGDLMGNQLFAAILYYSGIFNVVSDFVMKHIVEEYKGEIYDKFLRDVFGTMPMIWAIAQPDEYEACIDFMFPTDELKAQYSGLLSRIDNLYNTLIGMDDLLRSLPSKGVKVAVVAAYNTQMPPLYASAMTTGDSLLESDYMLGRATVADIGRSLGIDYVGDRVSADKCIDLSNVLFPEYTWAIKDGTHIIGDYGTDAAVLIMSILGSKEQPTVNSFEQFPQFMIMTENEELLPLE